MLPGPGGGDDGDDGDDGIDVDGGDGGGGDGDDPVVEQNPDATFKRPLDTTYSQLVPIRKKATLQPGGGAPGATLPNGTPSAQTKILIEDAVTGDPQDIPKQSLLWEELYMQTLSFLYDLSALYDFNVKHCKMVVTMINELGPFINTFFTQSTAAWIESTLYSHGVYQMFVKDVFLWQNWISAAEPWVTYLKSVLPSPKRELASKPEHWIHMSQGPTTYPYFSQSSGFVVSGPTTTSSPACTLNHTAYGWEIHTDSTFPTEERFFHLYLVENTIDRVVDPADPTTWASPHLDSSHSWWIDFYFTIPDGATTNQYLKFLNIPMLLGVDWEVRMRTEDRMLQLKSLGYGNWADLGVLSTEDTHLRLHYDHRWYDFEWYVDNTGPEIWTPYGGDEPPANTLEPYYVEISGGQDASHPVVWHHIHVW